MKSNHPASRGLRELSPGEMAAVSGGFAVFGEFVKAVGAGLADFARTIIAAFEVGRMLRQME